MRMGKLEVVTFKEVVDARRAGEKITEAYLYEIDQTRDGSVFQVCKNHPLGARVVRRWPK